MADLLHLSTKHRRVLETLLLEHLPDVEVWAYGSRVNGRSHDGSDLDLVLLGSGLKEIPTGQLGDFEEAVRESTIPFLVEARDWARLPERFHREIERNFVVLVGGSDALYDRGISDVADEWRKTDYGMFPSGFSEDSLENLCNHDSGVQTGPFGSQLHKKDYVSVGTPILTVEHLGENRIKHQELPKVSDNDRKRLYKYSLRKGDIVFSRVGSVDRRALVREEEEGWLFSGRCLRVRPDPDKIDSGYLSYFFGQPMFQNYIRSIAVGATMPSLNTRILSDVVVYYPPLPEQRTIAHILGTLDDKIELNRRMNETLEAMARALYKSWFVDFDPVLAKAALRKHPAHLPTPSGSVWSVERARDYLDRMGPAIADLFPDGFVESELGEIPEGWEVKPFSDFFDIVGGGTPKTSISELWGGSIPWFSVTDTPLIGNVYVVETEKYITKAGLASSSARLVPKGTTIISARGTVGNLAIAGQEMAFNQSCYALRGINHVGEGYVYFSTQHMLTDLKSMAHGSVFSTITRKTFESVAWPMPSKQVLNRFEDVIAPLFSRLLICVNGSRTLATLRDTLLPKLVSGEIRLDKENAINI